MSLSVNLKALFAAAEIAKIIEKAAPVENTVLDDLFPESVRTTYNGPLVPMAEIQATLGVVAVVGRGAEPVPLVADKLTAQWVEPLPIYVESRLDPVELNNLSLLGQEDWKAWATRKVLQLRRTIKDTMEAMASQAIFSGKIFHPLRQKGGSFADYQVGYGSDIHTITVDAADRWDHADMTLLKVYQQLGEIGTTINRAKHPGKKTIYAGRTAFATLLSLADAKDKPKVPVAISSGQIDVGGHTIKKMDEAYTNPATGAEVLKVPDKEIRVVSTGYTALYYASLDDLKAGLRALPIFVDAVLVDRPNGYVLTAQSKPLPVVSPQAVAKAVVIS
ncbi:MAG: major capsid protein [Deltaproteobacteria bacterium]|nr:major capsid protein [Deltaproteobacteria bacterium]